MANTTPLGPFLGMNNRLPDTKLRVQDKGDFLRNAVNVDITTAGTVRRRDGFEQVIDGANCHSVFSHGDKLYYADGTNFYEVVGLPDNPMRRLLRSNMPPGARLSHCDVAGTLVYTDGRELRSVRDGVDTPFTLPLPNVAPALTPTTGALPAGLYQVTYTFIDENGTQSGAYPPVQIALSEGSGLEIGCPPNTRVYMSTLNGDQLFAVGDGPVVQVFVHPDGGEPCETLHLVPMPGGDIVRYHYGRLMVAKSEAVFYSEPFAPGLMNPTANWVAFPAPVTVLEPCNAGVWVVADKTYWLPDPDLSKSDLLEKLPYGAAFGTGMSYPDRNQVAWYSERGLCVADGDGGVENIQEKNVATDPGISGASVFRENDGLKQLISLVTQSGQSLAVARSFMEAEVIRKETLL